MSERPTCEACGASTPHAFCKRCWRLAPPLGRAELAWWHGEFRATDDLSDDKLFAYAAWKITVGWLAGLIRAELEKRQAARIARRNAPKRRPKTLKQLADEAEARA